MLTQADYLTAISEELGAQIAGGPAPDAFTAQLMTALAARLPVLWDINATRVGSPSAVVVMLFTKRQAVQELLGQYRGYVDETAGRGVLRLQYSQLFRNLSQLYDRVNKELQDELTWTRANRRVASGRLLTRYPSDPRVPAHVPGPGEPVRRGPWFYGDANSERLAGWPWPYPAWPGSVVGAWSWGEVP